MDLSRLNSRQREAVLHGDGPLLMLAGAGSGKTTTMAYRIAHLIARRHISAHNILGLSFTNKAAKELKERVTKLVTQTSGKNAAKGLTISTFHSLCVRILRKDAHRLGYRPDFTILDQSDQEDIIRQILKRIDVDDRKFEAGWILFQIGQAKNKFLAADRAIEHFETVAWPTKNAADEYAAVATSVYPKYLEQLRALNAMDFDDLLFNAVRLLEEHPEARDYYAYKFRYILVDEYQDTNPAQFRLLRCLTTRNQNLCVVGDDDQSIYAWRGADPTHILEFSHHFPKAHTITLDQNYRSTATILHAANEVIQNNKKRHPKTLWSDKGQGEKIIEVIVEDDRAEADMVGDEIEMMGRRFVEGVPTQVRPWSDFAILYRSNPQSRLFEEALRMRKIPYKIVGTLSFLDRKEIKDLLCYWRLIVNASDDASLRRIVNWPSRGIGRGTLETLANSAFASKTSIFEAMKDTGGLAKRSADAVRVFRELIFRLRLSLEQVEVTPENLVRWGERMLEWVDFKRGLAEDYEDPAQAASRYENVAEMVQSLGQLKLDDIRESLGLREGDPLSGVAVLREYLAQIALQNADDKEDSKDDKNTRDQVTLLTLHGAKGLEYPVVFMVGMEDGLLPHRRVIEEGTDLGEERRLCYVGITRAKDQLYLTRARTRIRYGKAVPRIKSRFMDEIPQELLDTRDMSSSPDLSSKEAVEKHEAKVKDFLSLIRAKMT